jgi:hypothetical protein
MKLSWRDLVNTLLVASGAVIVYARLQDFSWWFVNSWRGTVTALAAIGVIGAMVAYHDADSGTFLSRLEVWLYGLAVIAGIFAVIVGWQWAALTFGGILGAEWLISTARHTRHTMVHENPTPYHGAYVH